MMKRVSDVDFGELEAGMPVYYYAPHLEKCTVGKIMVVWKKGDRKEIPEEIQEDFYYYPVSCGGGKSLSNTLVVRWEGGSFSTEKEKSFDTIYVLLNGFRIERLPYWDHDCSESTYLGSYGHKDCLNRCKFYDLYYRQSSITGNHLVARCGNGDQDLHIHIADIHASFEPLEYAQRLMHERFGKPGRKDKK